MNEFLAKTFRLIFSFACNRFTPHVIEIETKQTKTLLFANRMQSSHGTETINSSRIHHFMNGIHVILCRNIHRLETDSIQFLRNKRNMRSKMKSKVGYRNDCTGLYYILWAATKREESRISFENFILCFSHRETLEIVLLFRVPMASHGKP